jgi:hypothetical protein
MNAELLMLVGGLAAFLLTLHWVRSRDLREKYAVVWVVVASVLLVCGLFPGLIMYFADRAHLAYSSAVLFVALAAIYVFSFSVSVSLTHQYRRNARLMQELALLNARVQQLEAALGRPGAPPVLRDSAEVKAP